MMFGFASYLYVSPSFLPMVTQYAYNTMGYFSKKNIGIEDMEFPVVREMKILEISYFVFPPRKQFRTARDDIRAANH